MCQKESTQPLLSGIPDNCAGDWAKKVSYDFVNALVSQLVRGSALIQFDKKTFTINRYVYWHRRRLKKTFLGLKEVLFIEHFKRSK